MSNLVLDMPSHEYHAHARGFSKTSLSSILDSPAKYRYWRDKTKPTTPALEFGVEAHALILEPDVFYSSYSVIDDSVRRGTKAWNSAVESAGGKNLIKQKDWDTVHQMRESILSNDFAGKLIKAAGPVESSLFWRDPDTGLLLKARPDKLVPKLNMVVDLKTSKDISLNSFKWDAKKLRYHMSCAMTLDGLEAIGEEYNSYVFLVIEKEPPFECAVYVYDADAIEEGRRLYQAAAQKASICVSEDRWPSKVVGGVTLLPLP